MGLGDSPWFIFNAVTMMVLFVGVPWIVLSSTDPGSKIDINLVWTQSQEKELAACQAENVAILEKRDVYCVREFGRPDNTWEWVWGTVFLIIGVAAYITGLWKLNQANNKTTVKK